MDTVAPATKPEPLTSTAVPPDALPEDGETDVATGGAATGLTTAGWAIRLVTASPRPPRLALPAGAIGRGGWEES